MGGRPQRRDIDRQLAYEAFATRGFVSIIYDIAARPIRAYGMKRDVMGASLRYIR